jgi:hypothetical protein
MFIDNVINLAFEQCLVDDLAELFTPHTIDEMDTETIKKLASETPEREKERNLLQKRHDELERLLNLCKENFPYVEDFRKHLTAIKILKLTTHTALAPLFSLNIGSFESSGWNPSSSTSTSSNRVNDTATGKQSTSAFGSTSLFSTPKTITTPKFLFGTPPPKARPLFGVKENGAWPMSTE